MKETALVADAPVLTLARAADYLELTKPRVAVLVLFTVAAGAFLAAGTALELTTLLHVLLGTGLVAAGASALNQYLERDSDALMRRTENRPLPANRLHGGEVLAFGVLLAVGGLVYLAVVLPRPWAAATAGATFLSYVFIYTPLKRKTTLNTLIGAVPGALPPVIGWAAAGGPLGWEVAALFLILFLWQVPHFMAIAWIHRDDYARAGLRMVPVGDTAAVETGRHMVGFCAALVLVSLAPGLLGMTGVVYLAAALLLGAWFLWCTLRFSRAHSAEHARQVLRASLVYLPLLLAFWLLDGSVFPWAFRGVG